MLSYQHGFHAGNFADVHKHTALCLLLSELGKLKALTTFIDTHSGRGFYNLSGAQSQKTQEWGDGVAKLLKADVKSRGLSLYCDALQKTDQDIYPGSPKMIEQFMAPNHRCHCFELHPTEFQYLEHNFKDDLRVNTHKADGLKAIYDYLPKRTSPGLFLIDPSYEVKDDYETVPSAFKKISKRWPGATGVIWYPILKDARHEALKDALKAVSFFEMAAPNDSQRMLGTGLAVINAPEDFEENFKEAVHETESFLKTGP